jgi:ABC-type sugar transport system ATPase subunit
VTLVVGASPDNVCGSEALAAPSEGQPAPSLLAVAGLRKSFGATAALQQCSFELQAGEVHALVGENGSGKSTLVKILAGVHRPDAGEVRLAGRSGAGPATPRAAQSAGIVTVFQEVLVVGPQSVLENVWLGADGLIRRTVAEDEQRRQAAEVLTDLLGTTPDLDAPIESLPLSARQACCIARALVRGPRVLVLDESTSALDVATRDRLFTIVRRLCERGAGVIFISHRMGEIDELADRVTVLRSGESVVTLAAAEATEDALIRHMTGKEHLTAGVEAVDPVKRLRGDVLLRAEGVQLGATAAPINFALHAGELVGLAGLEGSGQDRFLCALQGVGGTHGRILRGDLVVDSPQRALAAGIAYVPRDRRAEAIFPTLSILENFALPTLSRDRRVGLLRFGRTEHRLRAYVEQLGIRIANSRQPITELSGGNQQKVVVARWLAASPKVLLLNDPTRGVDLGAKRDIYRLLEGLAADGLGVVMLSSEVDEHIELMDRVLVFREGAVSAELPRERLTHASIVGAFFGDANSENTHG